MLRNSWNLLRQTSYLILQFGFCLIFWELYKKQLLLWVLGFLEHYYKVLHDWVWIVLFSRLVLFWFTHRYVLSEVVFAFWYMFNVYFSQCEERAIIFVWKLQVNLKFSFIHYGWRKTRFKEKLVENAYYSSTTNPSISVLSKIQSW